MKVDRVAVLHSLRNGFGLTKTCQLLQYTPKELSDYLRQNPDFYEACRDAVVGGVKILLAASHAAVTKGRFDKWKQNNDYARNFIQVVNLWESYCKKEEVNQKKICHAIAIYKNIDEAATAMGLTPGELHELIMTDIHLANYIRENNLVC
jgi:hypothetical protein